MRWKKKAIDFKQRKVITKFLWLPMRIDKEIRWLEKATVRMRPNSFSDTLLWMPEEFLNS